MMRNTLHFLTCLLLPLTIAAAMWTGSVANDYSDALKRRAQLGLPRFFVHVPVAVELADTPPDLRTIFGATEPAGLKASEGDRGLVREGLRRDFFLIVGYTALMIVLGLRTWLPGDSHRRSVRWLLVILPVVVGVSDVLENVGACMALDDIANVSPALMHFTAVASWTKWIAGFAQMILLGHSLLGTPPLNGAGDFLRELAGLILLTAGLVGVTGVFFPSIIPNTFVFGMFAVLPLGVMLFIRDDRWDSACRLRQLRC
jgi:hypothetical protein